MTKKIHTPRPPKTRISGSWMCKCKTINDGHLSECKMIEIEKFEQHRRLEQAREKNRQEAKENNC